MSEFDEAINPLLQHEGGQFVPEDHGRGASKWGVTLATLREFEPDATDDTIRNMDPERAAAFYRQAFWERLHLGLIADQQVATKVLDLAVNMGGGTAVKLLQRAAGVGVDGILGSATAISVNRCQPGILIEALRGQAEKHYRDIVEAHPEYADCLPGWLARLAE